MVTGAETNIVAHHVRCTGHGGMGLKPPDWLCLPLTDEQHRLLHQHGEKSYWATRREDPVALCVMTMLVYLAQRPDMDLLECLGDIVSR